MNKFEPGLSDDGELARLRARNAYLEAECERLKRMVVALDGPTLGWSDDLEDTGDDGGEVCGLTGIYEWDEAEERCVSCSPELATLHGLTTADFIERHGDEAGFLLRLSEEDRIRYRSALDTMRTKGKLLDIEYGIKRPDGGELTLREIRVPVPDAHGELAGSIGILQDLSNEKRLRQALHANQRRFRHFAEASSHYLWEMGPDLKFTYVSDGIRNVTGEDPADFIGRTRRDIAGDVPIDPVALQKNLEQMRRRESFTGYLIERPRTTGGTVHLRISGQPIFDRDGEFLGYRGTADDVSDWRRTLDSLHQGQEKYRDLVEGSIQGMAISRDWKILFANQACAEIFGFASVEAFLAIESLEPFIVPEHRERLRNSRDARMRGENISERVVAHCVRPNGEVIWLESVNRLVEWEGEPAIQTTIVDVTERRRAEAALRESEARLRAIMDHAPFEICLKDAQGRYLEINRHYERLWGVENDVVRGRLPDEIGKDDRFATASRDHDQAVLQSGSVIQREYDIQADTGIECLYATKFPIRDRTGVVTGIGAITIDITKRKMAEQRLRQARDELESKVLQRTTELRDMNRALEEEIKERKQAEKELQRSQLQLSDAIESISEGFVLFDADEKLVMCNSRYRELHAGIADHLVVGVSGEELLRVVVERGLDENAKQHGEGWIQKRLGEYRTMQEISAERQLPDGRWVHGTIRKTAEGGIVGTRTDITERKNGELALQQSEDRLRQAAELAGLGYCIWDSIEDRCIYCSEEYARIHGTTVEGYIDRAQPAGGNCPFTHPEDAEAYQEAIDRLRSDGTGFGLEYRMILPNGALRHVKVIVKPVFDEFGVVVQEYLTMQDITAQKQTEMALRNNQDLLTAIMDHAPATIDVKDEQSRFVLVNRQLENQLGTTRQYICGKKIGDFLPPEIADSCQDGDRYVLESGRDLIGEKTYELNGREHSVYTVKFKIPELPGGSGAGVGRIVTDITELKRREQALRESQELLETIMDTAPVSLTVKDADSRYIYINRNELEIFGMLGVDYIGKQPEDFLSVDMAARIRALDRQVVETGKPIPQYEDYFEDADDRMRHWLSAKAPVIVDGDVRYIVTMNIDVTEAKARENELRQAQKMEAIGRLTSGIAHDFNNLLAVINGNLLFLRRKTDLGEDLIKHLDAIETAANLGTSLTRGLVSFSRHKDFNAVPADLPELIEGAMKGLFGTLPASIIVKTELAADTEAALTDPQQFQIALFNLVLNAKDAMPDGGTVTIATRNLDRLDNGASDSTGPWIELCVTDIGTGIPEDKLDRVFDPLFSTKPPGSGTGLGLSMVKRFVEQSKGQIELSSVLGAGTTVTMRLPKALSDQTPVENRKPAERTSGGNETLLVAEDDQAVRHIVVTTLTELGYHVLEASSGEQAWEILQGNDSIALLFSDIELGGELDGHSLAERALAHDPALKVLLCSGHPMEKERPAIRGKPPLMRKPCDPDRLACAVRHALDRQPAAVDS